MFVVWDKQHIHILCARFVLNPDRFDVVVATNLFGDILSDLGPACTGTIGLAPSANLNPDRAFPSLFEPVHGSAPDIAGKNIANPIAMNPHLPFADHTHDLNAGQTDAPAPKILETEHRFCDAFDGRVILLDDVVQILVYSSSLM